MPEVNPKGTKILIVDDEENVRLLVSRIVAGEGYGYEMAADVGEALARLSEDNYSLLISDINMPGQDGIYLLRAARESYPDLAVIMVTAVDNRLTAKETLAMGAYGYVIKPFERNALIINIVNALRRRELEIASKRHSKDLEDLVKQRTVELWQARDETIQRLAKAAEFRDNETAQHTIRVGEYCGILARKMGLTDDFCERIRAAAPLHDVGKIGIPDHILLKPGRLTPEEFEVIKTHCEIGFRILGGSLSEVLSLGSVISLTHHEKYNGTGYPNRLTGEAIPLVGRISAICDVFDALTSKRVYKGAMTVAEAVVLLTEERERHFDPELVDLFVDNLAAMVAIKEKFADGAKS
ncbi:MAG: response regulator [Proteobacteria bacterium]|nr:response regulator [Desulfobulbaceae bacterium]MBU4153992.1 response regulator [Pseudomonadota bacterium]